MSSIFNLEDGDKVTVNTTDFRLGLNMRWNKILHLLLAILCQWQKEVRSSCIENSAHHPVLCLSDGIQQHSMNMNFLRL